jgi:hypothetical protein
VIGSESGIYARIRRQVIPMAKKQPSGWYWATSVPADHKPTDGKPYLTELPGSVYRCYNLDGYPCCTYKDNGVTKAVRVEAPDRLYPMDPWLLEWGDLGGVCYAQPMNRLSFSLRVALQQPVQEDPPAAEGTAQAKKAARKRTPRK